MGDSENDDTDKSAYAKNLAKTILSNVAMMLAVGIYVVAGAYLFIAIEGDLDKEDKLAGADRSQAIESEREALAHSLWAHKWSTEWNQTVSTLLQEYHNNITEAISDYGYGGEPIAESDLEYNWEFASALLFTVSVVTTIGYGHVAPGTEMGQLVLIIYALIGIPLMLMFLANIGDAMAKFFRTTYGRGCCYCCNKRRIKEYKKSKAEPNATVADSDGKRPRSAWSEDYKGSPTAGFAFHQHLKWHNAQTTHRRRHQRAQTDG